VKQCSKGSLKKKKPKVTVVKQCNSCTTLTHSLTYLLTHSPDVTVQRQSFFRYVLVLPHSLTQSLNHSITPHEWLWTRANPLRHSLTPSGSSPHTLSLTHSHTPSHTTIRCPLTPALTPLHTHSHTALTHSITPPPNHSITLPPLTHSLTHSLTQPSHSDSLTYSLTHSLAMQRPDYVDKATGQVFDTNSPTFEGWLTKQRCSSLTHSLTHSYTIPFTLLPTVSHTHSLTTPLTRTLSHSLCCPLCHTRTHSLTH
jgi:hypothetical protein